MKRYIPNIDKEKCAKIFYDFITCLDPKIAMLPQNNENRHILTKLTKIFQIYEMLPQGGESVEHLPKPAENKQSTAPNKEQSELQKKADEFNRRLLDEHDRNSVADLKNEIESLQDYVRERKKRDTLHADYDYDLRAFVTALNPLIAALPESKSIRDKLKRLFKVYGVLPDAPRKTKESTDSGMNEVNFYVPTYTEYQGLEQMPEPKD